MVSFAAAAADKATQWIAAFTIEGNGTASGLYVYCSQVPDFAAGNTLYRDWVREDSWPDVLSERVDPLGGIPSASAFGAEIVDHDDSLTADFRTDRAATTLLDALISKATVSTSFAVDDGSGISVGDILWLGSEAMEVTAKPAADTVTADRAQLGTDAQSHLSGAAVYQSINFVMQRKLTLYVLPRAGGSFADAVEFGAFHVDRLGLSRDLNAWTIGAKSDLRALNRVVNSSATNEGFVQNTWDGHLSLVSDPIESQAAAGNRLSAVDPWTDNEYWINVEGEIILVDSSQHRFAPEIKRRGELGTKPGSSPVKVGDRQFLVAGADERGPSAFRFNTNNAVTTRSGSGWTKSDHWIDILLCLLTSSAVDEDGLELVNGDSTYGNWSSLPVGYGLGIPAAKIDFETFVNVRSQKQLRFPFFWIGEGPVKFSALATRHFLRPIGAYLTTISGKVTVRLPAIPLTGSTGTSWGNDQIDIEPVRNRVSVSTIQAQMSTGPTATSVVYTAPNDRGGTTRIVFNDSDFQSWKVSKSYYAHSDEALEIVAPSMDGAQTAQLADLAMRRLWRVRRPLWEVRCETGYDQYARVAGDLVSLTNSDLPDMGAGVRGWTDVLVEIFGKEIRIGPGAGTAIAWRLLAFGPDLRFGRICPSAYIVAQGAAGGGDFDLTIMSSLYTSADAGTKLPTSDDASFTAGDVVTLVNPDGSDAAATNTQIVQSTTPAGITVDGDFSGNLAAGLILVYADRAAAVSAQHTKFVFWAAKTDTPPNIGASTDEPWRFGE